MKPLKKIWVLSYDGSSRSLDALEVDVFRSRKSAEEHALHMRSRNGQATLSAYTLVEDVVIHIRNGGLGSRSASPDSPLCEAKSGWTPGGLALTWGEAARGRKGKLCRKCEKTWNCLSKKVESHS